MVKLMIADDHDIFREGLRSLLARREDIEMVAEAENGKVLLERFSKHRPAVLILDLSMPQHKGVEAIPELLSMHPDCRIVVLSMHCLKPQIKAAFKFGARGYLEKENAFKDLFLAIDAVVAGETFLSETVQGLLEDRLPITTPMNRRRGKGLNGLTVRELEVFKELADGSPTKRIAVELNLSAKTVETHRSNIMHKLQCDSVVEMTKLAIREGLIST